MKSRLVLLEVDRGPVLLNSWQVQVALVVQAQVWEAGQAVRLEIQVPLHGFHQEEINDADLKRDDS